MKKMEIAYNKFANKVHLMNEDTGKPFCGSNPWLLSISNEVDPLYFLMQPDPDNERCKRCEKIGKSILGINE